MPRIKAANNAVTTLVSGIDATVTSFSVADASKFPDAPFRITVDAEIMEVGAIDKENNDFSNVQRGLEGTTAASHAAGAFVENRWTAGTYEALADKAQDVDPKFDASTGHKHSGAAGDAPPVPWANVSGKPATYPPSAHKSTHASDGSDALTPADIGAVNKAGDTMTGVLKLPDGSATAPALAFADEADVGLCRAGTDILGLAAGGAVRAQVTTSGVRLPDGSADAPALTFINETDVGIYRAGTDILAFAAGGAERFRVDTEGPKVDTNVVWHAGNDGAESGLDADLLDGKHLSEITALIDPTTSCWVSGNVTGGVSVADTSYLTCQRVVINVPAGKKLVLKKARWKLLVSDLAFAVWAGSSTIEEKYYLAQNYGDTSPNTKLFDHTSGTGPVYVEVWVRIYNRSSSSQPANESGWSLYLTIE